MNDEQFKVCVDIIMACRDLDSFTNHEAGLRTGNSTEFIKWFTNKMLYIGCLRKVGTTRHNRHVSPLFAISPDAVTRLYRYVRDSRGELMPGGEQSERKRIEFCGKVVSKAYIEPGFGQSIITRMDAMLREVRCL
ncbi:MULTISPECIES: hypothetical protein [Morganella]|uniref:hypothetical protein n=1 Tax=Morganella TaxID=581 RepID=UPI000446964E|nr:MULTISPECIES: hypothetical protein [Morganella]EKU4287195.1 hypothetical protein [Morganella morganii]EKU4304558.1 hypothetical protein [Morganella morganii]EKU5661814.1 hypothetical protein [Morganella morganii]EKU5689165.1 hypothetical protein [Morganella morganii]EKU6424312.1 hypothetical protein [Morganella morganii]